MADAVTAAIARTFGEQKPEQSMVDQALRDYVAGTTESAEPVLALKQQARVEG